MYGDYWMTLARLCKVVQEAHGFLRDALPPEVRDQGAVLADVLAVQAVQARLVQQQIPQVPASACSAFAGCRLTATPNCLMHATLVSPV